MAGAFVDGVLQTGLGERIDAERIDTAAEVAADKQVGGAGARLQRASGDVAAVVRNVVLAGR